MSRADAVPLSLTALILAAATLLVAAPGSHRTPRAPLAEAASATTEEVALPVWGVP